MDGLIPFSSFTLRVLVLLIGSLLHMHGLQAHLNRTEPYLLVTPAYFLMMKC